MKTKSLFCAALLCAGLGGGCAAARPNHYYQLTEVTAPPAPEANPSPYHVTLMIGQITGSQLYREDHIVYTGRREDMGVYQYERWAAPPTDMIVGVLLRSLFA